MSTLNEIQVVRDYIDRGWPVFPLLEKSKAPAIAGSFRAATTDLHQVSRWQAEIGRPNWAVATGKKSALVLDSDGEIGKASIAELARNGWPETFTVKTRTGIGRHYYFQPPTDFEVPCSVSALAPGIDIRGEGGYVVIPPSYVPKDHKGPGGTYEIQLNAPVATLPTWLESKLRTLYQPKPKTTLPTIQSTSPATPRRVALLCEQLRFISADCDYEQYRRVIWAILNSGWSCAEDIARSWSESAPHRFNEKTFNNLIRSFDPGRLDCPSLGSIVHAARQGGWNG
jgi:hypothetical protein